MNLFTGTYLFQGEQYKMQVVAQSRRDAALRVVNITGTKLPICKIVQDD